MLEVKNISSGYRSQMVLDGASATFEKGRLTSIIGENGCGKTTLLKATLGILPLMRGKITIDEQDLHLLSRNEIAKKIAYLSQEKNIPDMTVQQMVLHGRFPYLSYPRRYTSHDKDVARRAMAALGISEFAEKPLYSLSGGMRQNAYIAMALAQDTDYILLDEPTTYLDISHQLEVMKILRSLADKGKGVVTVMHDLPMAFDFSDEILVIQNGQSKMRGKPDALYNAACIQQIFNVGIKRVAGTGKYYYDI